MMPDNNVSPNQPERRHAWASRILQPRVVVLLVAVLCMVGVLITAITGTLPSLQSALQTKGATTAFQLRPGWQQVALYSGRGSATHAINRTLPSLWAAIITCTGDKVSADLSGPTSSDQIGTDNCHYPELSLDQPTSFSYNEGGPQVIHTIKVAANARTSWQLHLLQAIRQPALHLGSEWTRLGETISGSGIAFTRNSPHDAWQRQTPATSRMVGDLTGQNRSAQTWGIVTICFGKGSGYIHLLPAVGNLPLPVCDGQPKLTILRFPGRTTVQDLEVTASGDMTWNAGIVACLNETACQQKPALQVTPRQSFGYHITIVQPRQEDRICSSVSQIHDPVGLIINLAHRVKMTTSQQNRKEE